jgi:hypothetical protein
MKNLYEIWRLVSAVVDQNRGMHQLAYTRTPPNRAADVRESF